MCFIPWYGHNLRRELFSFQDISPFSSCNSFWCTEKQVVSAKALLCTSVVFWHSTRADTMMTALSPPSSYSITNGRVWYQRLFPHQTTLRPPFIAVSCSSLCLKAPRRRRQLQKKRKNNPPFPRKWRLTLSQYTKIYQRILFYHDSSKILRMRERLVPGPYLSPSAPAHVKGPGYEAKSILW